MDRRVVAEAVEHLAERGHELVIAVAGRVDGRQPHELLQQRDQVVTELVDRRQHGILAAHSATVTVFVRT